jgi:hypothetical protein
MVSFLLLAAIGGAVPGSSLSEWERASSEAASGPTIARLEAWRAERDVASHHERSWLGADVGTGWAAGEVGREGLYGTSGIRWTVSLWGPAQRARSAARSYDLDSADAIRQGSADVARALAIARHVYLDAWNATRKLGVAESFLRTRRTSEEILDRRERKGLVLRADHLEYLTTYLAVDRDTAWWKGLLRSAEAEAGILAPRSDAPDWSELPDLPVPLLDSPLVAPSNLPDIVAESPLQRLDLAAGAAARVDAPVEGDLTQDVRLFLEARFPLGAQPDRIRRDRLRAESMRSREASIATRRKADLARAIEERRAADVALRFAQARFEAALQQAREARLRTGASPIDPLERKIQAEGRLYRTAIERLDAHTARLHRDVDLLELGAREGARVRVDSTDLPRLFADPAPVSPAATPTRPWVRLLAWDPAPLVADPERWGAMLQQGGIGAVALSWTAAGFDSLKRSPRARGEVAAAIATLERFGISCDLLLGEPTWLIAGQVDRLTEIVSAVSMIPFRRIVLDLEPLQLDSATLPRASWAEAMARATRAVGLAGDRPVDWILQSEVASRAPECLDSLDAAGAFALGAMFYSRSAATIETRSIQFLRSSSRLPRRIVVSIESPPALAPDETLEGMGRARLHALLDSLAANLSGHGSFEGFDIQSFEDWTRIDP